MVAIFTGAGAGFQRGSANILGGNGQIGSSLLGRGSESVSVNAANGNLLISHQDEFLVGLGPDVGISRSYNSLQDAGDGDNGDHWQQSTTRRIFGLTGTLNTAGSTISRLSGDGSVIAYAWNATANAYVSSDGAGAYDKLSQSAGVWTWTDGDSQATETYAAYGTDNWRIVASADADGNSLTYTYNADKLDKVTTADGAWVQYAWSGGNITQILTGYTDLATSTAKTLTRVRYAYDGSSRLVSVTTDLSPQDNSVSDGKTYVVTYTYDGASNRVASIAQSDGSLLTIGYDGSGRVTTLTQAVSTGVNRTTSIAYSANYTEVTAPNGQVTRLDYDAAGQLTKITAPPAITGATNQTVQFAYDTAGNVLSVTDGNGKVTAYAYDGSGNATQITDANGNTVQRTYDSANRLITELAYGADETGGNVAHYSQYAYDSEGHLRFAVNAAGQLTEYRYNASGQLLRTIRYPEHQYAVGPAALSEAGMASWAAGLSNLASIQITENQYDARGNLLATVAYGGGDAGGGPIVSEGTTTISYVYDQAGNLLSQNRAGTVAETYLYDGMGRLVGSTNSHGGNTSIVFDDANTKTVITGTGGYVTTQTYNKAGDLLAEAGTGFYDYTTTTSYGYDSLGRARVVQDGNGGYSYVVYDKAGRKVADVDHFGDITEYRYDAANRLIATIAHANALSSANLALLADPNNAVELSTILPGASASDIWSWDVYDDGGRLLQTIDNLGGTVAYEYDHSDRVIKTIAYATRLTNAQLAGFKSAVPTAQVLPTASSSDAVTRNFYNEAGQLVGVLDGEGYLSETRYDSAGQVVEEIQYAIRTLEAQRASASFATLLDYVDGSSLVDRLSRSVYDGQGLLRFSIDAQGGVKRYDYDPAGRITAITLYATPLSLTDFTFDAVKAAIVTSVADRVSYTVYNTKGEAAYAIDAEGGVTANVYDVSGQLIKSTEFATTRNTSSLPDLATMDGWAASQASNAANRVSRQYFGAGGRMRFSVDAEGYITYYNYDLDFRLWETQRTSAKMVITDATTADQIGNVAFPAISAGQSIGTFTAHDNAGRVAYTIDGEGIVTRYAYNALGQAITKTVADGSPDAVVTSFTYDGAGRVISQTSAVGASEAATVQFGYDAFGNRTSVTDSNGGTTNYTFDRIGQVLTATNSLGGVTAYTYDTFGNVVKVTNPRGKASFSYYDSLNRLVATRDAEGYVTRSTYNRFGEVLTKARYAVAMTGEGQAGVAYFSAADVPPNTSDPFAYAAQMQATATALAAQATNAEAAAVQAQANAASAAQAATAADAAVDDIEAQIDTLSGGGLGPLYAQRDVAQADADAAHAAASAAQASATALQATATQLRANATAAQTAANTANTQATTAETTAAQAAASATTAAQAAATADATVASLQSQIAALGTTVDFSSARSAALADPITWLNSRKTWLQNAANAIQQNLIAGNSGGYVTSYNNFKSIYSDEASLIEELAKTSGGQQATTAQRVAYINQYFDNLTWEANNLGADRTAALANPSSWMLARKTDEERWINSLISFASTLSGSKQNRAQNTYEDMRDKWTYDTEALYDLAHNTYSTGWPSSNNQQATWYNNVQSNPNYVPSGITATTQQVPGYRSTLAINAYFDVQGVVGNFVANPLQQLQAQLATATAAATAAHTTADQAQANATSTAATATGLRTAATQAQANADALDAQADTAEANAAPVVAAAAAAAQAASAADAVLAGIQAQIVALIGTGPISFETQRSAALASMSDWLTSRYNWVGSAKDTINQNLVPNASGLQLTELQRQASAYGHEKDLNLALWLLLPLSNFNAQKAFYINRVFDNITWQANNLGRDRNTALAGPLAWLETRKTDLENQIDGLKGLASMAGFPIDGYAQNTYRDLQAQWASVVEAIYDLAHNTYATVWPDGSTSTIESWYNSVKSDPGYIPAGLQQTGQQAVNYRAGAIINAFFDARGAVGTFVTYPPLTPMQALQYQLTGAQVAAASTHASADQAQAAALSALATATQARATADQAQNDADAALAAAETNTLQIVRDNFVLLDLSQLGASAKTQYSYDRLGRVTQKTDAEGYGETYGYDAFDDVTTFTRYNGGVGSGSAATTRFEYDRRSELTKTTDAAGFYESYTYDAFGNRVSVTAKSADGIPPSGSATAGGTTTYTYDKRGLLLSETLPINSYDKSGGSLGAIKTTYQYDRRGNLITKVEGTGLAEARTTTYSYDKLDRLTTTTHPSMAAYGINNSTKAVSSTANVTPTETVAYDVNGNIIKTVDASGAKTVFYYDALGRKTVEINALGTYTAYAYDANGNVVDIAVYENPVGNLASLNGGSSAQQPAAPSGAKRETTFTYDNLGRMLTSSVIVPSNYKTGVLNGSTWSNENTLPLTTAYQYDFLGNVVKLTDPNGAVTYSYYDKLGRKTAQVDAEGYLATWSYNSDGNVVNERRYSTRYTGTPSTLTPPVVGIDSTNDRVTDYTYDLNGNRTSETRQFVKVHGGSGTVTTTSSWVRYTYNGLGQVLTKTEATGDVTSYTYDLGGRLTLEKQASHQNYTGSGNVTPQVAYSYDSFGDLVRTAEGAGSDVRITQYEYDKGGHLTKMIDAENKARQYLHDAAGRLVMEYYDRTLVAGSSTQQTEGIGYRYDALGRNLGQGYYLKSGSSWAFQTANDYTTIEYNVFGQVTRSGINGIWQQQNQYDVAGRLWASNAGDGIWKYFGYDRNGNQTITIVSAGADLSGKTFAQAFGAISQANVNATYTKYDKRNLAIQVTEEGRQLAALDAGTALTSSRTYNAFGEVASETNAGGATVTYTYNTMGRMIRSESAAVQIYMEDGTSRWVKPSEDFYYDASGRLVAKRDSNGTYATGGTSAANAKSKNANTGNLTQYTYLAGTGYGGSQGSITKETHADGGYVETKYDIHGDARTVSTYVESGLRTIQQSFDKLGRLTQATRVTGLIDSYSYDELGHQLSHGNDLYGTSNLETTAYDMQGRITSTRAFGGATITRSYAWDGSLEAAGTGLTDTGGWTLTSAYSDNGVSIGKQSVEVSDTYGRTISKTDLGGNPTNYTYDLAGRLVQATTTAAQSTASYKYTYYNTGQVQQATTEATQWYYYYYANYGAGSYSTLTQQTASYTYDEVGNRKKEYGQTISGGVTKIFKDENATYDALGRILTISAATTDVQLTASTTFRYDANGNIREKLDNFYRMNNDGTQTTQVNNDNWFRYDSMNRVVLNNGQLVSGVIVRRPDAADNTVQSETIAYNKAGDRISVATTHTNYQGYYEVKETYGYNTVGQLTSLSQIIGAMGSTSDIYAPPAATGAAVLRSSFQYDTMGRQTREYDYDYAGTLQVLDSQTTYNARGLVATQVTSTVKTDNKTYNSTNTNNYGSGASYALGALVSASNVSSVVGTSGTTTTTTTNSFLWRDSVLQASTTNVTGSTTYSTSYNYNPLGQLVSASINDGKPRTVTFSLDEVGQVIRRDESKPSNAPYDQIGSPHEVWYRFGDREFGHTGNNGDYEQDLNLSIMDKRFVAPSNAGTYRGGRTYGLSDDDFTVGVDRVNAYSQGSKSGGYTVKSGDTLQSIAQRLYGDAQLWYKIAEVNGVQRDTALIAGQQLVLPAGVVRNTYNADTFRPYDPAQAIGDLSPTTPAPPKKPGCGGLGMILLAVVAIAVAALTYGALAGPATTAAGSTTTFSTVLPTLGTTVTSTFTVPAVTVAGAGVLGTGALATIATGAIAGAAGSIASQAVGVLTGIQDKFNWGSVGLAALAGGVGGALGADGLFKNGAFSGVKSGVAQSALRAATSSAVTQGIAVATGLQDKFSWAGVAAAGAAAGAGYFAGKTLGATPLKVDNSLSNQLAHLGMSTAALLASAATRSAIDGSNFGDSIMAGLPDVIGQAISDAAINGVSVPKEQVKAVPTSGGGSGGYRSSGSQLEDALKSQFRLGGQNIPVKFGGQSNPMFDYSAHLSIADLKQWARYGLDSLSSGWDEVQSVFEPSLDAVKDEIVVIGNKAEDVGHWLTDYASRQATQISLHLLNTEIQQADAARAIGPSLAAAGRGFANWSSTVVGPMAWRTAYASPEAAESAFITHALIGGPDPLKTQYYKSPITNGDRLEFGLAVTGAVTEFAGIARGVSLATAAERAAAAGSRATLDAASRANLLASVRRTRSFAEAKGLVYSQREGLRLGYDVVLPSLTYRGSQGIDLALQSSTTGRYAIWEAKGGLSQTSLSALSTDTVGITQGSARFIDTRLGRYIRYGDGADVDVAVDLQNARRLGKLDSFASLYSSRSTYQLPLTGAGIRPAVIVP